MAIAVPADLDDCGCRGNRVQEFTAAGVFTAMVRDLQDVTVQLTLSGGCQFLFQYFIDIAGKEDGDALKFGPDDQAAVVFFLLILCQLREFFFRTWEGRQDINDDVPDSDTVSLDGEQNPGSRDAGIGNDFAEPGTVGFGNKQFMDLYIM